jgi:hypothetical protein
MRYGMKRGSRYFRNIVGPVPIPTTAARFLAAPRGPHEKDTAHAPDAKSLPASVPDSRTGRPRPAPPGPAGALIPRSPTVREPAYAGDRVAGPPWRSPRTYRAGAGAGAARRRVRARRAGADAAWRTRASVPGWCRCCLAAFASTPGWCRCCLAAFASTRRRCRCCLASESRPGGVGAGAAPRRARERRAGGAAGSRPARVSRAGA